MFRTTPVLTALFLLLFAPVLWADEQPGPMPEDPPPATEEARREQEIRDLKALVQELQQRLERLEKEREEEKAETERKSATSQSQQSGQDLEDLRQRQVRTNQRILSLERDVGLDRIRLSGDFRFEAHSVDATLPAHYDGMLLQNLTVKTLFFFGQTGQFPQSLGAINNQIAENFSDFQFFSENLTFNDLRNAMGQFSPQEQQQLSNFLMPATFVPEQPADNNILYTNRLRLNMHADVGDNVSFTGRLGMYKVFGDSTGVQVFNGSPTSVNIDGTTVGVPNSDQLRVERAYFTWSNVAGQPLYLSVGRRPSTAGAPLNFRHDEPRGGTPAGSLIDYQFDGITVGYHMFDRKSTLRLCYGLGYESGFGSGDLLRLPQDRLDDAHFLGVNWDLWRSERTFLQTTVARAFNVTDGFNGLVVLPNNPVTGASIGAPLIMRFTPSSNLGNINLGSVVLTRRDGPMDWFVSANVMLSDPDQSVTTPFGGLFSDPFETPDERVGSMFYVGARWTGPSEKTKVGFEFNHGSKYWFNFAHAEDDILSPKTAARGDVYETYVTHRINRRFILKFDFIRYDYDYSGSGWHLGAPKRLDSMPVLGFPTYSTANKFSLGMIARF